MFKTGRRGEAEKQTFIRFGRINASSEGGDRSPVTPGRAHIIKKEDYFMDFFNSAVDVLQTLVIALGAGLGIWGAINLLEGYGNDNPGAKSQGMKHLILN